jgi:hypothetical protein
VAHSVVSAKPLGFGMESFKFLGKQTADQESTCVHEIPSVNVCTNQKVSAAVSLATARISWLCSCYGNCAIVVRTSPIAKGIYAGAFAVEIDVQRLARELISTAST